MWHACGHAGWPLPVPLEELVHEVDKGCSAKTLRSGTPGVAVSQQLSVRTDWATAGVHAALGGVVGGSGAGGDDEVERGAPATSLDTQTDSAHFLTPTGEGCKEHGCVAALHGGCPLVRAQASSSCGVVRRHGVRHGAGPAPRRGSGPLHRYLAVLLSMQQP